MPFRRAPSVAPPARRCRGSMFATAPRVTGVHPILSCCAVLSTACGGGDALVGGVEQYRRELRHGRGGRTQRRGAHDAPRGLPAPVGRPGPALGRGGLAPRRDPDHHGRDRRGCAHRQDGRPRLLQRHRRTAALRPPRRPRRRPAPPHLLARQLHDRRPDRPPDHRHRRPRRCPPGLLHALGGRHGVRHRRAPARRPHRGPVGHRPPGRPARLPRNTGGAARRHPVRRSEAHPAGPRAHPPRGLARDHRLRGGGLARRGRAPTRPGQRRRRRTRLTGRSRTRQAPGPAPRARDPAARPRPGPRHGPRRPARRPRRTGPRHRRRPVRRQRLRHPRPARRRTAGPARHPPRPRHGRRSGCSPSP